MTQEFFYVLAYTCQGTLSGYESAGSGLVAEIDDPRIRVYTSEEIPAQTADTKIIKVHRDFLNIDALP